MILRMRYSGQDRQFSKSLTKRSKNVTPAERAFPVKVAAQSPGAPLHSKSLLHYPGTAGNSIRTCEAIPFLRSAAFG